MATPTTTEEFTAAITEATRGMLDRMLAPFSATQPLESTQLFQAVTNGFSENGPRWNELQQRYYHDYLELWLALARASQTGKLDPVAVPEPSDRRFQAAEWRELPYFDYLKQAYLLNSRWLTDMVEATQLDEKTKHKVRFYTRQLIDAAAPSNFPATNPEAIKHATQSNGDTWARGMQNLGVDLKKGRISMTDETAFEIGRNVAVTPGTVVFENELLQLIQYHPSTDNVYERPLLMVPPCINKYYVLDLQPENSFVRYAVSQGHTVFMVSWRNVGEELAHLSWDDYLEQGVIKAIDVAREIGGVDQINVLGFCVGGTLLGSALAVLAARGVEPAASVTLLASMLDFSDVGDLSVFVDENFVKKWEREAPHRVVHGRDLATTFSSLRANELVWYFVINNYLKGRAPPAFDLLYWNSDSTNLPGVMYAYYLRNMYLENNLRTPGKLTMCGVPVDLSRIKAPAYVLGSREDHIVPWKTAFETIRLIASPSEFVLAGSGHIAGIINPMTLNKRDYSINPGPAGTPEEWVAGAQRVAGSWWGHWSAWLAPHGGAQVAKPAGVGSASYPALEPAPGSYVRQRCAD